MPRRGGSGGDGDVAGEDEHSLVALLVLILALLLAVLVFGGLPGMPRLQSSADRPRSRTIDVAILPDSMSPSEIRVDEGDEVTLRITSVRPVAFQLHGFDIQQEVAAGRTTTLRFEAKNTGRFAIDDEQTRTWLGALVVRPRAGR